MILQVFPLEVLLGSEVSKLWILLAEQRHGATGLRKPRRVRVGRLGGWRDLGGRFFREKNPHEI